jgi:hypothetical protein
MEDNLHFASFILGGGRLRGRILRGSLLPGEVGKIRKFLVLKTKNSTPKEN